MCGVLLLSVRLKLVVQLGEAPLEFSLYNLAVQVTTTIPLQKANRFLGLGGGCVQHLLGCQAATIKGV